MSDSQYSKDLVKSYLVGLLNLAHIKGEYKRFPDRYKEKPDIHNAVMYYCNQLDKEGVPFSGFWGFSRHRLQFTL